MKQVRLEEFVGKLQRVMAAVGDERELYVKNMSWWNGHFELHLTDVSDPKYTEIWNVDDCERLR